MQAFLRAKLPFTSPSPRPCSKGASTAGIDLGYAEDVAIDHSFVTPLMLTTPDLDIPIVPIVQNCRMPPMPTLKRSHAVGHLIGDCHSQLHTRRQSGRDRYGWPFALGGRRTAPRVPGEPAGTRLARESQYPLSLPASGPVNESFDLEFLAALGDAQAEAVVERWSTGSDLEDTAGNGAQEIRNWLLAAGVADDAPAEVLGYAAVPEWHTGTAVAAFDVATTRGG